MYGHGMAMKEKKRKVTKSGLVYISGYVHADEAEAFDRYKAEKGLIKDAEALRRMFREFFKIEA